MSPMILRRLLLALSVTTAAVVPNPTQAQSFNRRNLHRTSFEESVNRYPSPLAMIELIKSIAPNQGTEGMNDSCLQIGIASSAVLGAIDPAQIQPLEQSPGALFFNYFEKCAKKVAKLGFQTEALAKQNSEAILGTELSRSLASATGRSNLSEAWSVAFAGLSPTVQDQLVDQFIYFLLGSDDLLRYYKYIGEPNVFRRPLQSTAELRRFLIEQMISSTPSRNDSILVIYSRLAVLLRLGPALKN
jgi:hypothetical protein